MSKTQFVDTEVSHGKFTVTHDARTDRVIIKHRDYGQIGTGHTQYQGGIWDHDRRSVNVFREITFNNDEIVALLKCLQDLTGPEEYVEPSPSKAHP